MAAKKILIAPLDWGLGHATRCIPIIKSLQREGHEIILSATGRSKHLLKKEFPDLAFTDSPAYTVRYSGNYPMWLMMLLQAPLIMAGILREHRWLRRYIKKNNIDEVISDNRYGLWSDKIPSVFITHQLMIKCPRNIRFLEPVLHKAVMFFVRKYTECWIPDKQGSDNLSGDLSHAHPHSANIKFIGPLSRFQSNIVSKQDKSAGDKQYRYCFILSGPEPQRTLLENIILSMSSEFTSACILIRGKTEETPSTIQNGKLEILNNPETTKLPEIIELSEHIVCRSGYSMLMDLNALERTAILIPTPGQTEQEYLAEYFSNKKGFYQIGQQDLNLDSLESIRAKYVVEVLVKKSPGHIIEYSE